MLENKLLSTLLDSREAYEKLKPYLDSIPLADFNKRVLHEIKQYYEADALCTSCDRELISFRVVSREPKKEALVVEYFASLPAATSVENLVKLYEDIKKAATLETLVHAISVNNHASIRSCMQTYLEPATPIDTSDASVFNATPIEELEEYFTGVNRIPIYPTALNAELGGGVPRQTQIAIVACPDVGKTTAAINLTVGAAESGFKVGYIANEEATAKVVMRLLARFCRTSDKEILTDKPKWYEHAMSKGYGNVVLPKENIPNNYATLRQFIEKHRPDVMIVDQIRNFHFNSDSPTMNLERGAQACRELAKEFNLVSVIVTQAADSAINKVVLHYDDVQWSNIGFAGALDLMIGVGQNMQMNETGHVMLSFPKNKLSAPIKPMQFKIDYVLNRLVL